MSLFNHNTKGPKPEYAKLGVSIIIMMMIIIIIIIIVIIIIIIIMTLFILGSKTYTIIN